MRSLQPPLRMRSLQPPLRMRSLQPPLRMRVRVEFILFCVSNLQVSSGYLCVVRSEARLFRGIFKRLHEVTQASACKRSISTSTLLNGNVIIVASRPLHIRITQFQYHHNGVGSAKNTPHYSSLEATTTTQLQFPPLPIQHFLLCSQ